MLHANEPGRLPASAWPAADADGPDVLSECVRVLHQIEQLFA
jgi:hypothetical protein